MNRFLAFLFLLFLPISICLGQTAIHIDSIPQEGILLNKGWKFHAGDNPDWVKPTFNDSAWQSAVPTKDIMDLPGLWKTNIGWFRLKLSIDSSIANKSLALLIQQTGASEIFLNGQLIGRFGEISDKSHQVKAVMPIDGSFIGMPIRKSGEQVLAVRFALQKNIPYISFLGRPNVALALRVMETKTIGPSLERNITPYFDSLRFGLYLILSITHVALFLFNPSQKTNLYFFLYALLNAIGAGLINLVYRHVHFAATKMAFFIALLIFFLVGQLFFLAAVYKLFNHRRGISYWIFVVYAFISVILFFINYHNGYSLGADIFSILILLDLMRVTILAARERQRGATIVICGAVSYIIFYILYYLFLSGHLYPGPIWIYGHLAYNISDLSIPIAISIYLALESSFASRSLQEKLKEVKLLSEEKQHFLATQNETLEKQVTERTAELNQSLIDLKSTQTQLVHAEKMASLGELTAGIAHEIQNPLNFVNNFSEVSTELVDELAEEQQNSNRDTDLETELLGDLKQNLQKITQHGQRASSIVKGMLEHSRTSTGQKEPTNLNALAEEYLRLAYQGFRAKDKGFNCELITHFEPNLPQVKVVPQEIGRVLLNLCNNAFYALQKQKTTSSGYQPTITVSTTQVDGHVEIRVRDNGTGIPDVAKAKIFQPFFTTKPTGEGTGLGLSLSYDIVTKGHGGTLDVTSKEGEGTEFIVKLPMSQV